MLPKVQYLVYMTEGIWNNLSLGIKVSVNGQKYKAHTEASCWSSVDAELGFDAGSQKSTTPAVLLWTSPAVVHTHELQQQRTGFDSEPRFHKLCRACSDRDIKRVVRQRRGKDGQPRMLLHGPQRSPPAGLPRQKLATRVPMTRGVRPPVFWPGIFQAGAWVHILCEHTQQIQIHLTNKTHQTYLYT